MGRIEVTGSCGDLLFSSHTLHGMITTLMVVRNAPNAYFVTGIAIFSMVMLPISLLAFRDHYRSVVRGGRYVRAGVCQGKGGSNIELRACVVSSSFHYYHVPNINSHDIVVAIYTCYMLWKLLEHVVRTTQTGILAHPATQP